jgi:hypothetical protein
MDIDLYKKLYSEGLISKDTLEKAEDKQLHPLFSVHWELKTLLYLGVMLLSTGLGILIYKNIDTIGHQVILLFIALICVASFAYCIKHKKPFSLGKVPSPNSFFDYILLLACLSLLSFLAYLQSQYEVFGTHYGIATLIPMLILFYVAYDFDHMGIQAMAITNLGLYLGVTITPYSILAGNFENLNLVYTYLFLGFCLLAAGYLSKLYNVKKHFKFNYTHFGLNLVFLALLMGYFMNFDSYGLYQFNILWLLAVFFAGYYLYQDALKDRSFYFLLLVLLYVYVALSLLVVRFLSLLNGEVVIMLGFFYFIASAALLVKLLSRLNTKLKEV